MVEIDFAMGVSFLITAAFLIIFIGMLVTVIDGMNKWNKECNSKGLSDNCLHKDVCEKDCQALGKTFFKFEKGMFSDSNCWCLENGNARQIW